MALVVENGSGLENANTYLSLDDFKGYADAHGLSYADKTDPQIEAALIRATVWLDATYRARWPGSKVNGREQSLAWPRSGAYDTDEEEIAEDEVPQEVLDALAEAAWRELTAPGVLSPDLDRGGDIRRLKAGSIEIEYGGTASARTTYTIIDGLLAGLLMAGTGSSFIANSVRGQVRLQVELNAASAEGEYFLACARIRGISPASLLRRLVDAACRDRLVHVVLDDADEFGQRRRGEQVYRGPQFGDI